MPVPQYQVCHCMGVILYHYYYSFEQKKNTALGCMKSAQLKKLCTTVSITIQIHKSHISKKSPGLVLGYKKHNPHDTIFYTCVSNV
jgi:hypothetical protein